MLIYMFKRSLLLVLLFCLHGAIIGQITDYKGTYYVDGNVEKDQYRSHISLESLAPGASTVYATNGVHLVLTRMRINKTSGSLTDPDRRATQYCWPMAAVTCLLSTVRSTPIPRTQMV